MFDARAYPNVKEARDAGMIRLVDDAAKIGAGMLLVERDDQTVKSDRVTIRARAELAGCVELCAMSISVRMRSRYCQSDAIAWSWAEAGHWRRRANRLVTSVIRV